MIDRIQLILKTKNLSSTQFADEINVKRSNISHILTGRNKPSLDLISKILIAYPEINSDWLMLGKGQMFKKSDPIQKMKLPENELFPSEKREVIKEEIKKEVHVKNEKTEKEEAVHKINEVSTPIHSGIKKIILFYKDNTFQEIIPKE